MKRIHILMAAIAAVTIVSCGPKEPVSEAKLSVEPRSLTFVAASAPSQTITVTAQETEWEHKLSENSGWVTVNRDGDKLTVSVTDNEAEEERNASITITATASGLSPVTVAITQAGKQEEPVLLSLSITPEKLTFAGENAPEQEVTVSVTGDITWKAYAPGKEDWIHITTSEGKFSVKVDDNPASIARYATVTVSPSDKTLSAKLLSITQEALAVDSSIEAILPNGATPEEGILLPFTSGMMNFSLKVAPETANWTATIEGEETDWLTLNPVVSPEQHALFINYGVNALETPRTLYIVIQHEDLACPPLRIKVTQQQKSDLGSTILEDVDMGSLPQLLVNVQANNDFRDLPYTQWTFTLYSDGITYDSLWGNWKGSGDRIRIVVTGKPQLEKEVELEEMTCEIIPYDEFNVVPATERKPDMACAGTSSGMNSLYPSGTWYQVLENGKITGCANAVDGKVTITKEGEDYTISWDFTSDAGCKITGSYTGPIQIPL